MTKHFLVEPNAEIVNRKLPLFTDNLLGDDSRKDITNALEKEMVKYGGIGLSANQIGLPFRMFVMGGHPLIEEGKVRQCWNPEILETSEEMVEMKEGCLTFHFYFYLSLDLNGLKLNMKMMIKKLLKSIFTICLLVYFNTNGIIWKV